MQRAWFTVILHPWDCCLHSLLSQGSCLPCSYSQQENYYSPIYLLDVCCPSFQVIMSYHEETIIYTVYFMGAVSVTLHKEGTMALVLRVHLSLSGARNNFTCNLHFKSRCRVVKETNWRKGKNGRKKCWSREWGPEARRQQGRHRGCLCLIKAVKVSLFQLLYPPLPNRGINV